MTMQLPGTVARLVAVVLIVAFLGSSTGPVSLPAHTAPPLTTGSTFDFLMKSIATLPDSIPASLATGPGTFDPETAVAWVRLRANPSAILASISAGQGGREKLALVRVLLAGGGRAEAEKAISPFLTAKALHDFSDRFDLAGIPGIRVTDIERTGIPFDSLNDDTSAVAPSGDNPAADLPPAATRRKDTALHIMGGASIALLAAAAAFEFLPAWSPLERALLLAAIGICAATFFGALKEAMDAFGPGAVEMRDFLNTVAGGALAGVAIGAFSCLVSAAGLSIAAGIVTFAVGSLILGIPVGRVFIESSLGKLRAPRVDT